MAQDKKLQKLELTWIGKDDSREPIEPRILIENPDYSYGTVETGTLPNGKSWNGNMLIHGDNLLALKALEQNYTGAVKCIYIDPPFNTGARINADGQEIGYDDGIEHSIWLNMMYERFAILYNLLRDDGAIFVHLDDNEADYCKVILDEIFHRENFMNRITIDARSPSVFSTVNPGMFVASEYILYYVKDRKRLRENQLRAKRNPDYAYNKYITNVNSLNPKRNKVIDRVDTIKKKGGKLIFDKVDNPTFRNNLVMLDGDLPVIIAHLLLEQLNSGISALKELSELITEVNPLGYDTEQASPFYAYKIKHLLTSAALGMMPATAWSGKFDANGGYLVVKKDGDILCYHFYDRNRFEDYLFSNAYLERSSTSRHEYASIIKEDDGTLSFKLNFQVRLK